MGQREQQRKARRLRLNILSEYNTISDAIDAFGVGRGTVYRWLKLGKIPYRSQVWLNHRGVNVEKILEGI